MVDVPQMPDISEEEMLANLATHEFRMGEDRCIHCDCNSWGRIRFWPCGMEEIPREEIDSEALGNYLNS